MFLPVVLERLLKNFTFLALQKAGMLTCMDAHGISLTVNAGTDPERRVHGLIRAAAVLSDTGHANPVGRLLFMDGHQLTAPAAPYLRHLRGHMEHIRIQTEYRHSFRACHPCQQPGLLRFLNQQADGICKARCLQRGFINGLKEFERIPALDGKQFKIDIAHTGTGPGHKQGRRKALRHPGIHASGIRRQNKFVST